MTPPPGSAGGLLNPIVGSSIMTGLAVAIGTPLGMLAGTYMAEYGRHSRLTHVVRFINDILLSAPSIVIGLFIYEIMVAPDGALFRLVRRRRARRHRDSSGRSNDRGHAVAGAQHLARSVRLDRHAARAHDLPRLLPRGDALASLPAFCWRSRVSAARRRRSCLPRSTISSSASISTRRWRACPSSSSSLRSAPTRNGRHWPGSAR